jgi:hypothetical protein
VLSLAKDGDKSTFVIARNKLGKIIGAGGCVINGDIAYLTGLRVAERANIPKAYAFMREFCSQNGVRLTYTTILEDNTRVQEMLEKKRPYMPDYLRHSVCAVNIIRKNLKIKDKNKLVRTGEFYTLQSQQGEDLARGKAVEQWDYKQYIIKHYGWRLRIIKPLVKWMPKENEILKFFTLKDVQTKDTSALESFLRHISHLPLQGSFFLYGGAFCPVKSIKYRSIIYIVDWDKTINDVSKIHLNVEIASL